jgi:nucleosome binding factor SPN SPT16 subunit
MKLDLTEVYFLKQVSAQANIKASDAKVVVSLMAKLEKEYERLLKAEQAKATE